MSEATNFLFTVIIDAIGELQLLSERNPVDYHWLSEDSTITTLFELKTDGKHQPAVVDLLAKNVSQRHGVHHYLLQRELLLNFAGCRNDNKQRTRPPGCLLPFYLQHWTRVQYEMRMARSFHRL